MKLLCPLKFCLPKDAPINITYDCEKEKCGWWISSGVCAIREIADQLYIKNNINNKTVIINNTSDELKKIKTKDKKNATKQTNRKLDKISK